MLELVTYRTVVCRSIHDRFLNTTVLSLLLLLDRYLSKAAEICLFLVVITSIVSRILTDYQVIVVNYHAGVNGEYITN